MENTSRFDFWELPSTIILFDPKYDREVFQELMQSSIEDLCGVEGLADKVLTNWSVMNSYFENGKKFICLFCWSPQLNKVLPFPSVSFYDEEVDVIAKAAEDAIKVSVEMCSLGFEFKLLNDYNRLLGLAIQALLELNISRYDIDGMVAQHRGSIV